MPTNLDRIQTLLQPDPFARVRTLAKHNRRTLSAMAAELVEEALKLPKYKQQLEEAVIQVPVREDTRTAIPQKQLRKSEKTEPGLREKMEQMIEDREEMISEAQDTKALLKKALMELLTD